MKPDVRDLQHNASAQKSQAPCPLELGMESKGIFSGCTHV